MKKINKLDTIKIKNIFGSSSIIKGTIISRKQHGFNKKSGAWTLNKTDESDEPAEFMLFRPYCKKKNIVINMNRIITDE